MQSLLVACAVSALAFCGMAHAASQPRAVASSPMVVEANRIQLGANQAVAPVVVFDREEIVRSQAVDVATLLETVPGINISRYGGPGQKVSIFVRGANSDQTLVLLNGVPINPGTIGGAALQNIMISGVERIEVVKGPRSSLYGSGAIGGVINIVSRTPEPGMHVDLRLKGGSNATRGASATVSGAGEHFEGAINASRTRTDGFPTKRGSTLDRGYDNTSLNVYGKWHNANVSASVRHWQTAGTAEYLGFSLNPKAQDYTNRVTSVTLGATPDEDWHTELRVSHFTAISCN